MELSLRNVYCDDVIGRLCVNIGSSWFPSAGRSVSLNPNLRALVSLPLVVKESPTQRKALGWWYFVLDTKDVNRL